MKHDQNHPVKRLPEQTDLVGWFDTPLGKHLLECEQRLLSKLLPGIHGFHSLQLAARDLALDDCSPVSHHFLLNKHVEGLSVSAQAEHESLPLAGETIDLVVLHHALEFSSDPHQLLREVSRVLIAGGHVVICGFNPLSSWGLRRLLSLGKGQGPWAASMMTSRRMADWLKLLDFKVTTVRYGAYCWPVNNARCVRVTSIFDRPARKLNWPTGGFWLICARKQIAPLTPASQRRRVHQSVSVGIPVVENLNSAARQDCND